uniref:Uncharacterized protein n=1 Tax=Siphoviridae sp. ctCIv11 TaxID=2827806 RepID=A0A8S5S1R4_9CAUD|nr:MAG TPA: hypothetical protein [Siphoviridae sp. ctCIv11]
MTKANIRSNIVLVKQKKDRVKRCWNTKCSTLSNQYIQQHKLS